MLMYNLIMSIKSKKAFNILGIALVVVLVLSLVIGTILVVTLDSKVKPEGTLAGNTIEDMPKLIYPDLSVTKFKNAIDGYLKRLAGFPPTTPTNFALITNGFLEIFQSSQISAEKLDRFSEYLGDKPPKDKDGQTQLSRIVNMLYSKAAKLDEDGNPVLDSDGNPVMIDKFDPEANVHKFLMFEEYRATLSDIMQYTNITPHEMGKIAYYTFLYFSYDEAKEKFKKLGEKGFSTLFIDLVFSIQLAHNFLDEGGSLPESRMVGELLYQTGNDLSDIIDNLGVDFLVNLIAPDNPFRIFSKENLNQLKEEFSKEDNELSDGEVLKMVEEIEEIVNILSSSRSSLKFLLLFLKNTLLEVKNLSFENFSRYTDTDETNRIKYQKIALSMFANQFQRGIELTKKESEFKTNDDIAINIAGLLTRNKSFRKGLETEEEKTAYFEQTKLKIQDLLNDFGRISIISGSVDDLDSFNNMKPEDRNELEELFEKYKDYDFSYLEGTADFSSMLFVTAMLEIYVQSFRIIREGIEV